MINALDNFFTTHRIKGSQFISLCSKMSKRKAPKENPNSEFCDFLIGMLLFQCLLFKEKVLFGIFQIKLLNVATEF